MVKNVTFEGITKKLLIFLDFQFYCPGESSFSGVEDTKVHRVMDSTC